MHLHTTNKINGNALLFVLLCLGIGISKNETSRHFSVLYTKISDIKTILCLGLKHDRCCRGTLPHACTMFKSKVAMLLLLIIIYRCQIPYLLFVLKLVPIPLTACGILNDMISIIQPKKLSKSLSHNTAFSINELVWSAFWSRTWFL